MEKLASKLKLFAENQENVFKSLEEMHYQAFSEYKNHMDSIRTSMWSLFKELAERETERQSKEKNLEAKEKDIAAKEKNLEDKEFQKNSELGELESLIVTQCDELQVKQKEYSSIQMTIKEKMTELGNIQRSILEGEEKLNSLEKRVKQKTEEAEVKAKEVDLLDGKLKKIEDASQLKESRLKETKISYEVYSKKLDLEKENLKQCQISTDEFNKEIKSKQEKLKFISSELELKEKPLYLVQELKEKNLDSLRKSMDKCANQVDTKVKKFEDFMNQCDIDLDAKESNFEDFAKELELKGDLLESQLEELDIIDQKVKECLEYIESKEEKLVEDQPSELNMKEGKYEGRQKEVELRQAEFESIRRSVGLREAEFMILEESNSTSPEGDLRAQFCQAICSVHKAPDVTEAIRNLILRGETIHAVAHICELKLTDKFSPMCLLTEYLEDAESFTTQFLRGKKSNDAKEKAKNKEVAALRAVMECMKICNLKSQFLSHKILKRLSVLEKKCQLFGSKAERSNKRRNISLSPGDQSPPEQGNFKSPRMSRTDNIWTKPPEGYVKLNFGFADRADCCFVSVVARDHNAVVLAIWCRKIMKSDPLVGQALAALGALSWAASSRWDSIILEGDSVHVMGCLQRSLESPPAISNIVSESVSLLGSFRRAIPVWIPTEANMMAQKVSMWAAGKNDQVGPLLDISS